MTFNLSKTQHTLLLCGCLLAIVYFAGPVLLPFILGFFIAWLFLKPAVWLQHRGIDRRISAALVTLLFCSAFSVALFFLGPALVSVVQSAVEALPDIVPRVTRLFEDVTDMPVAEPLETVIEDVGDGDVSALVEPATKATAVALSLLGSTFNAVMLTFVTPFTIYYLLADWQTLVGSAKRTLPKDTYRELKRIWLVSKDRGLSYIKGRCIIVFWMAIIHIAGLLLIGTNHAVILGLLAGVSVLVPVLGNLVVFGLALIIGVLQFDTLWPLVAIGCVFAAAQILEMAFIEPYLLGETMEIHPFVVLLVLLLGAHLLGVLGAILALPVTAIFVALLDAYHHQPKKAGSPDGTKTRGPAL